MQRQKLVRRWLLGCCWISAAAGCASAADSSDVDFGESEPVGRWSEEAPDQDPADPSSVDTQPNELDPGPGATSGGPGVPTGTVKAAGASVAVPAPSAGAEAAPVDAGVPSNGEQDNSSTSDAAVLDSSMQPTMDAGTGGVDASASSKPMQPSVSSVEFTVTTEPVGGRYRPKNIGAIWVTDDTGSFVRSLEVWARTRRRYLTNYTRARGSTPVDVTATATLSNHRTHTVTWDLTDVSGNTVEPGSYTLFAEVTDKDATGQLLSVDFDTSAGPTSSNPASSTGFTDMTLELK